MSYVALFIPHQFVQINFFARHTQAFNYSYLTFNLENTLVECNLLPLAFLITNKEFCNLSFGEVQTHCMCIVHMSATGVHVRSCLYQLLQLASYIE